MPAKVVKISVDKDGRVSPIRKDHSPILYLI